MKSFAKLTLLCLLSVVAFNYGAKADDNLNALQTLANANQTLANSNQTLVHANQALATATNNQVMFNGANQAMVNGAGVVNPINYDLQVNEGSNKKGKKAKFKKTEFRGYIGGTVSTFGGFGAKVGLEVHHNLNKQNGVYGAVEGTYYIPQIENKFYNKMVENVDNNMMEYYKGNIDFKDIGIAISEKGAVSLMAGARMKFLNTFSMSPYAVFSVGYGRYQGYIRENFGNDEVQISQITQQDLISRANDTVVKTTKEIETLPISDYGIVNEDGDRYGYVIVEQNNMPEINATYNMLMQDYKALATDVLGTVAGTDLASYAMTYNDITKLDKNAFFVKFGAGVKFELFNRLFLDFRYQCSPFNTANTRYINVNGVSNMPKQVAHEISASVGIYLF